VLALLNRWDGPFDEKGVGDFLQDMREGAAVFVYWTTTTEDGIDVPDLRGWFQKEANGRFAAQIPLGTFISGDLLNLDTAVDAFCRLNPEYAVHNV
jgi:hypothetical protein